MTRRFLLVVAASVALGTSAYAGEPAPHGEAAEESPPGEVGHGEAALEEIGESAHGGDHDSVEFNWAYGFVGEKEGITPDLLYRPKGMPPPFLANIFNALLLFALVVVLGKKPIVEALKKRKERIVVGMQEAGRMKEQAAQTLAGYEEKLQHIDDEIERIRREMREAAEAERRRVQVETEERRVRMERDARLLVEQELKAAREALVRETVAGALRSAQDLLAAQLSAPDHDRLAREYLETLARAPLPMRGGRS